MVVPINALFKNLLSFSLGCFIVTIYSLYSKESGKNKLSNVKTSSENIVFLPTLASFTKAPNLESLL